MRFISSILLIIITSLFLACQSDTDVGREEVKAEAQELVSVTKEFTEQQKQAYTQRMKETVDQFEKQIKELQHQTRALNTQSGMELRERKEMLKKKLDYMSARLSRLEQSSGAAWETIKTGLDSAHQDLKQSMKKAADEYK